MSQQIVSDGAAGGADLAQEAVDVQRQTSFYSQLDSKHWRPSEYSFDSRTLDMKKVTSESSSLTTEDVHEAKSSGGYDSIDGQPPVNPTPPRSERLTRPVFAASV